MTSQITSKAIDYLRFPLILGVVFGHCHIPAEGHPLAECVESLISDGVVRMTVPLFFVVSGYLFFHKVSVFSRHVYAEKIRSRFHSILVPYLIWNFIAFALILRKSFFEGTLAVPTVLDTALECFIVGTRSHGFPEIMLPWSAPGNFPLWFIRDIFVFALVSPLFYIVLKRCGAFVVGFLAVCFLAGWWVSVPIFSITGVLFFSLGAWMGIKKLDPAAILASHRKMSNASIPVWVALVILSYIFRYSSVFPQIYACQICIGVVAVFQSACLTYEYCRQPFWASMPGGAIFCIYVMHGLLWFYIPGFTTRIMASGATWSSTGILALYVGFALLSIAIPLIFYAIMNRIAPGILRFMLGGRTVMPALQRR